MEQNSQDHAARAVQGEAPTATKTYADPADEGNSAKYLSGRVCIERGCGKPAGTAWSHLWCFECNVKRMNRIDASLNRMMAEIAARSTT
jgi:hypothetical protein